MAFKRLNRVFWGCHLWARGYLVASFGNITDEVCMHYIENQGKEPTEDDFKINEEL